MGTAKKVFIVLSLLSLFPFSPRAAGTELPAPGKIGENRFVYRDKDGVDPFGETYELACVFSEGLAAVKKGGKWGFIDLKGKVAIPFGFDGVSPKVRMSYRIPEENQCGQFTGDVATVKKGNRWGMIDRKGKFLVEPEHIGILFAAYSVAPDNTLVESKAGSWFFSRIEQYAVRLGDARWDFVKDSDVVVELKYGAPPRILRNEDPARRARLASLAGKLRKVSRSGKYGYEDWNGNPVIPATYSDARDFSEGVAPVSIGGKWGYIDNTGKVAIEPRFSSAFEFSGGMAAVQVGKNMGYIDRAGKMVVEPAYQFGYPFQGDKARVLLWDGKFRHIDRKGAFLP